MKGIDPHMITVTVKPTRRMFAGRKQWKFEIRAANGERIDPRDTYANVGDIYTMLHALHGDPIQVEVHYTDGVERTVLP